MGMPTYPPRELERRPVPQRGISNRANPSTRQAKRSALTRRIRDHTLKLFEKHGMQNIMYWLPDEGEPEALQKLVYLLAHDSQEAAKKSFEAFRSDPDWLAAKKASEDQAGGSLTNPEQGVVSEWLAPTGYSPLK